MKIPLTQNFVLKLNFESKPIELEGGKVDFEPNNGKPYIVFDAHRNSVVGFGVKVAKTKKTYLIQRKIDGRVIKTKIGDVRDFPSIEQARSAGQKLLEVMKQTGRNPNTIAKERVASEITLGQAFEDYESHLRGRAKPAKPNTFAALGKARKRLSSWENRRIKELSSNDILGRFDEIAKPARTAAEQTFRWAIVAVKHAIQVESHEAESQKRASSLTHNPFGILTLKEKFRSRIQLEADYKAKGVRNPMTLVIVGQWLDALWVRRRANRTGCDYLLASLLLGTRKMEAACLAWRDRISDTDAQTSSWVDMKKRYVFFHDPKNRQDHELPISDALHELLLQRYEMTASESERRRRWVFPAESHFSKVGHYSNSQSLQGYIRSDAGIQTLRTHDLRRTFGRIVEDLGLPYSVVKRFLNQRSLADTTTRYTDPEWSRLCEYMQRIEDAILMKCPTVYNALRPLNKLPLVEGPAKTRTE